MTGLQQFQSFKMDAPPKILAAHLQTLTRAHETGDRSLEGRMLSTVANLYFVLRQYYQALDYYSRALSLHTILRNRSQEAAVLGELGKVFSALQQYPEALNHLEQGFAIAQEIGDRTFQATYAQQIQQLRSLVAQPALPIAAFAAC